jgi:anti-sigma regulatory factor (Ser/Thr protein kinase)
MMMNNGAKQHMTGTDLIEFRHVTVPAHSRQLCELRRELDSWLTAIDVPSDIRFALVVAANEAATNVVEHAYRAGRSGTVEMAFWIELGVASIEVCDHGKWSPVPARGPAGEGGCGIPLMRALAEQVRIDHDQQGTRVLIQQTLPL